MICVISGVYRNLSDPDTRIRVSSGNVDAILLDDESEEVKVSVRKGMKASILKLISAAAGNYSIIGDYLLVHTKVPIFDKKDLNTSSTTIQWKKTLWSIFRELGARDAQLVLDDGSVVHAGNITASRTSDSVYVRYQTAGGEFRSSILSSLSSDEPKKLTFRRRGDSSGLETSEFSDEATNDLVFDTSSENSIAASYSDFVSFISPHLIAAQQRVMEIERVCQLAGWFSEALYDMLNGNEYKKDTKQDTEGYTREKGPKPRLLFDVHSNCVTRAELKGLLYGVQSPLVLKTLSKCCNDPNQLSKSLEDLIPEKSGLDNVFVFEVSRLMPEGIEAIKEHRRLQNFEVARQSLIMHELRCMMLEYDYLPSELKTGVTISGTTVRIRSGGV